MDTLHIGKIIETEQEKDAIHIAVAPVIIADGKTWPGNHVGRNPDGSVSEEAKPHIGILDPFLSSALHRGEKCWLFLYPGSITSLRHGWTHPAFDGASAATIAAIPKQSPKAESEAWMRSWASKYMTSDYSAANSEATPRRAYEKAIYAGHSLSVGENECARDHLDDEWWTHWENITGEHGQRGEYFSCGC